MLRLAPIKDERLAREIAELLQAASAEGVRDGLLLPPNVLAAVRAGERCVEAAPGHYSIRVDGAPKVYPRKVEFSAGGAFTRSPKTA